MFDKKKEKLLQAAVGQLIVDRKFTVAKQGKDITLIKKIGKRPVSIFLKRLDGGGFWINNPSREDRCVNSFLDFADTPMRVTRNKDVIGLVVQHLKNTSMWEFIENKDFFVINKHNNKANKKVVESLFQSIRSR